MPRSARHGPSPTPLAPEARPTPAPALPARADFLARLGRLIAEGKAGGLAVLCLDLDRFQHVNAAFGHEFGDAVLRGVAIRLRTGLPEALALAHLGGDEFALVVAAGDGNQGLAAAERVAALLAQPLVLDAAPAVRVTSSIGVSLYPQHGHDPALLLDRADIALYGAKERSDRSARLYSPAMESGSRERQGLLRALHEAIEQRQFSLAFQPKLRLADHRPAGAEVLARWISPGLGEVSPERFVPIAEDAGLIEGVGAVVVALATDQLLAWRHAGVAPGRLAINVSAAQLRRADFVDSLAAVRARLDPDTALFEIEVTESALMASVPLAQARLAALRELGAVITLDDFGTGYSSFSHLKHLPIDALKIAPQFVCDIGSDARAERLVAAMIALARALGLRVVAEGIETQAQADFLAAHGCDEGQGFLFARPLAAPAYAHWLAASR